MCDPAIMFSGEPIGASVMRASMQTGAIYFDPPLARVTKAEVEKLASIMAFLKGPLRKRDRVLIAKIEELETKLAALQHIGTGAGQAVNRKYE